MLLMLIFALTVAVIEVIELGMHPLPSCCWSGVIAMVVVAQLLQGGVCNQGDSLIRATRAYSCDIIVTLH
jgi:hypothetical protein